MRNRHFNRSDLKNVISKLYKMKTAESLGLGGILCEHKIRYFFVPPFTAQPLSSQNSNLTAFRVISIETFSTRSFCMHVSERFERRSFIREASNKWHFAVRLTASMTVITRNRLPERDRLETDLVIVLA